MLKLPIYQNCYKVIQLKIVPLHAMIELERHIEILLLDCDCVIVPGFGGFVAHHRDARFDETDGMFLPPLRTLGFNAKLNMNDSLLVQSYVEAYDISYPEALARVETEVDELKQTLEKEGYYEFENLGSVSLNAVGGYTFEPCESGILTPELYGLAGVDLAECFSDRQADAGCDAPANVIEMQPVEAQRKVTMAPMSTGTDNSASTKYVADEDTEKAIKIKVSVLRNAIAVACAVVAFFMIATPLNNGLNKQGKMLSSFDGGALYSLLQQGETSSSVVKAPVHSKHVNVVSAVKTPVEQPKAIESQANEPVVTTKQPFYCIVMACRISKSNADSYAEKLRKEGLSDARVLEEKPVKVVCGSYASEGEALSALNKLREDSSYKDCWIFYSK